MPSKDPINLAANAWMESSDLERLREIASPGSTRGTSRTAKSAATVQGLAARLGRSEAEMASKIPEDTLRRLKYAVIPVPMPDGSTRYDRDIVEREGVREQMADRSKDFSPTRGGEPASDLPQRDAKGRFVK